MAVLALEENAEPPGLLVAVIALNLVAVWINVAQSLWNKDFTTPCRIRLAEFLYQLGISRDRRRLDRGRGLPALSAEILTSAGGAG